MTGPPKEREKCLDKKQPVNLPDSYCESMFASHVDDVQRRVALPFTTDDLYKFNMAIFGVFLLISLAYTTGSMYGSIITALDDCSESTRHLFSGIFLAAFVCSIIIYCVFNDTYNSLTTTAAIRLYSVFNPVPAWHGNGVRALENLLRFIQLSVLMFLLRWSLVTLVYGVEISAHVGKWTCLDNINGTNQTDHWSQIRSLDNSLSRACLMPHGTTIVLFIALIVSHVCFGNPECQSTTNLVRPSTLRRAFSRIYGEGYINLTLHIALYFALFVTTFAIFPALSGRMTKDDIDSFNWLSTFFIFTVPAYTIFLAVGMALELFAYCFHCDGKGAEQVPTQEDSLQMPVKFRGRLSFT